MIQDLRTYVLYTEHHKELHLANYLTSTIQRRYPELVSRIYVPKAIHMRHYRDENNNKKWKDHEDLLFYNYIFIESSDIIAFSQILKTLHIDTSYYIVGKNRLHDTSATYNEYPVVPVSEEDMARLNSFLGSNGIVGKSTFIKEGSHVEFLSGPLKGKEANVKKVFPSKHVAIVEMEFLGELRRLSLAIEKLSDEAKTI